MAAMRDGRLGSPSHPLIDPDDSRVEGVTANTVVTFSFLWEHRSSRAYRLCHLWSDRIRPRGSRPTGCGLMGTIIYGAGGADGGGRIGTWGASIAADDLQ